MNANPLVSVVVITYNSSKYILETLNSVKTQTYLNIELIITDDCSTDDTVPLCRDWLLLNKKRFVRAELVISSENTGIPANCNRGFRLAQGEWIKGIAGDDLLVEDGIRSFIQGYKAKELVLVGSCKKFFTDKEGKRIYDLNTLPNQNDLAFYHQGVSSQYHYLLYESPVISPSVLINKKIFEKIGYFEEKYNYIDDYPFWFKCLSSGYRIVFFDVLMVYYRCQHESITSSKVRLYNKEYQKCLYRFRKDLIYPHIAWYNLLFWQNEFVQKLKYWILLGVCQNKKNKYSLFLGKIIAILSIRRLIRLLAIC